MFSDVFEYPIQGSNFDRIMHWNGDVMFAANLRCDYCVAALLAGQLVTKPV
jgi:hypothetical protein